MKTSSLILWAVVAFIGLLLLKRGGVLNVGVNATAAPVGGVQSAVPKSDLASIADDLTSIFNGLTSRAQTAPKTT